MAQQKCHSSNGGFHYSGALDSVHYVPNVNSFQWIRIAIFALFSKVKSGESGLTL